MKPTIVITGAAGLIGSGLVQHLNEQGEERLLLVDDCGSSIKWKNLVGKRFVDLISRKKLFSFLEKQGKEIEAIVHLGACSDTTEMDFDYLLENNYRYTIDLSTWALKEKKRFIYASSAATYGDGSLGFSDEMDITALKPLNPYGYSKQLVDLWLKRQGVLKQVVGLKYFNVFGPNEYHKGKMASMILKMTPMAQKPEGIRLFRSNDPERFADGEQMRDFIYVKDAAKMTAAFLFGKGKEVGGLFNIGLGQATSWNTLARAIFRAIKQEENISYIEMPPELSKQYQNYTCATMDKFFRHFPEMDLKGVEKAVQEYVGDYLMEDQRW